MGDDGSKLIIIKGGSVHLVYDSTLFTKDPNDPQMHKNDYLKIARIVVQDAEGMILLDTGEASDPSKYTVIVACRE